MPPDEAALLAGATPLLQLHPQDNVGCLPRSLPAGAVVAHGARSWRIESALGLGHKIAVRPMKAGEKVIKFGVSIGSAKCEIFPGQHVHLHNLGSDYLPTFTLSGGEKYGG